jgi:hypothetical protein
MVAPSHKYVYAINEWDVISDVDPAWLAFASENGAAELTRPYVIGRSLWEFIEGKETQQLYASIIQRVRTETPRVVIPFRCDSPTLRRYMRLTISRQPSRVIRFESFIDRVEPRGYLRLLDSHTRRTQQQLTLCSCCKRALIEPSGWMDIEDAAAYLHLFEQSAAPQLRQIICPACASAAASQPSG